MDEHTDSTSSLANGQQAGQEDSDGQQLPESARINGLMRTLGSRTHERDQAREEAQRAMQERDEAQQALDEMLAQFNAQPSQAEVLAADEASRTPAAPTRAVNEAGEVLMTESQWQQEERAGRTFVPIGAAKPSQLRHDTQADDLDALNRVFAEHLSQNQ